MVHVCDFPVTSGCFSQDIPETRVTAMFREIGTMEFGLYPLSNSKSNTDSEFSKAVLAKTTVVFTEN